jgi:excisionase family DNA binding protein
MSDKDAIPLTITVSEAARRLGIGRSAAYQAVALKQIPAVRIGKLLRVPLAALERKLEAAGKASDDA